MTRRCRAWSLATVLVLTVAAAAHVGAWYLISRHLRLSGAIAAALIVLAVVKHLGWLGGAYALLRRRRAAKALARRG